MNKLNISTPSSPFDTTASKMYCFYGQKSKGHIRSDFQNLFTPPMLKRDKRRDGILSQSGKYISHLSSIFSIPGSSLRIWTPQKY